MEEYPANISSSSSNTSSQTHQKKRPRSPSSSSSDEEEVDLYSVYATADKKLEKQEMLDHIKALQEQI